VCVLGRDRFEKEFDAVQDVFELQVWSWPEIGIILHFAQLVVVGARCRICEDGWANANLQRNLNNAFAYDLVPSPSVITAALKAARRVNDYPTAVRIFEGTS